MQNQDEMNESLVSAWERTCIHEKVAVETVGYELEEERRKL
jgi:hypothetical protein